MSEPNTSISEINIAPVIYTIRSEQVMLDRDLAILYGIETKRLKEAVRRNIYRFPSDFMFEMSEEELQHWRTHFASSNADKIGLRYAPMVFTEQGIAMLSSVVNTLRSVAVNIAIMRTFVKMRKLLLQSKEFSERLHYLEEGVFGKFSEHDEKFELIFNAIRQLTGAKNEPRRPIGFNEPIAKYEKTPKSKDIDFIHSK
jgi:hypothetical protein